MFAVLFLLSAVRLVAGHASIWHSSMFGFNVTDHTFPYDNRPVVPLANMPFNQWWFHNHLGYPPHPDDVFELPAGQKATAEIACNKGATSFYASSEGGDIREPDKPNDVCPHSTPAEYHTTGIDDVKGCGLAIAYKSDANQVQPEDFTIFSVNHTCVWNRFTDFAVPEMMPSCPNNKCICAFFWIHSPDSGSEQNYMNGFQCRVTGSISNVGLATPKVARRCGADPDNGKPEAVPGNCTYGPKQPLYWFQAERNNMFEGTYAPPFYNDLYNFKDGAQNDIFQGYYSSIPEPGPDQKELPVVATPGKSPAPIAPGGNPTSTTTTSVGVASPTVSPSDVKNSSGATDSQCPGVQSASTVSRRHVPVERGHSFARRFTGMTRRSRSVHPERRMDIWNPL